MKSLLFLLPLVALSIAPLRAADDARLEKLRAADDERVAAVMAGDRARLGVIFADNLRYAHSSGTVDDKATYVDALATGKSKYTAWQYEERNFTFPAPDVALMTGRAKISVTSANGANDMTLSFLAVWKEEKGQWRFLAWQSCRMPAPSAAKP